MARRSDGWDANWQACVRCMAEHGTLLNDTFADPCYVMCNKR